MSVSQDNKRVAKNTVYMYIRMAFSMLVGLYTSRVLLQALGVEDYGLYNVIGGIISIFTVLNSALINTTSRFITVSLAKGIIQDTRKIFNMALMLHFVVGLLVVAFGETIGLWYLHNKLVVPEGREVAAEWLYQFTIVSAFLSTVNVPYNASIIAHEKINVYAIIQIADVVLKLIIVLLLAVAPFDKLIFYAMLILGITMMNVGVNIIYCHRKFEEVRLQFFWNWRVFKEMLQFVGWALVGNFSNMFYTQGINLMLNAFCGPAVNAARGIAVQVQGVVSQFASNVQTAINPQILKSHAVNETERLYSLIIASSRLCFYLLFLISLPIFIETEFLLQIWLGNVPDHTVNFVRIILMCVLLDAFINPMFTANLASGKLALYHGPLALLMYAFMFVTYFSIKTTRVPESVFICYFAACLIGYILRIFILYKQVGLSPKQYLKRVLLPVLLVVLVSLIAPITVHYIIGNGWVDFLLTTSVAVISVIVTVYALGITPGERNLALSFVNNKIIQLKGDKKQ